MQDLKEKKKCYKCEKKLELSNFTFLKHVCNSCYDKIKQQENNRKELKKKAGEGFKFCERCKEKKIVLKEIYFASFNCYECEKTIEQEKKDNRNKQKTWSHPCKDCGKNFVVNKNKTWFICEECKEKREQIRLDENSKQICCNCKKVFIKHPSAKTRRCLECTELSKKYFTICVICKRELDRDFDFNINKLTCDECSKKLQEQEEFNKKFRKCIGCNEVKIIDKEIKLKGFYCFKCQEDYRKQKYIESRKNKPKSWVRHCKICEKEIITTNPRATVLNCDECNAKFEELRRQKLLNEMNYKSRDYCQICKQYAENELKKDRNITCPNCREKMQQFKASCLKEDGHYHKTCRECNKDFQINNDNKFWEPIYCNDCSTGLTIKKVKGARGFKYGHKGVCSDGHKYESLNEQDFDEWLTARGYAHQVQSRLRTTLCRSDFYLAFIDLHIEVDGLDRNNDVDWEGKLQIYADLNLRYIITKPCKVHFRDNPDKCFAQLDEKVLPILKGYEIATFNPCN